MSGLPGTKCVEMADILTFGEPWWYVTASALRFEGGGVDVAKNRDQVFVSADAQHDHVARPASTRREQSVANDRWYSRCVCGGSISRADSPTAQWHHNEPPITGPGGEVVHPFGGTL